jgi:TolA-binding protein
MSLRALQRGVTRPAACCAVFLASVRAVSSPAWSQEAASPVNDTALRDYLSGNGLLNRGLHELAITEYRKFLVSYGDHVKAPLARYGLAVALFRLNRFEEAVAELTPLRGLPDFVYLAEVWTIAGQCELALKTYLPAAASFHKVVQRFAEHELADDGAAGEIEALYLAGRYPEAAKAFDAFASRWPQSALLERALYFAGLAEVSQEHFAAAADRFEKVVQGDGQGPFAEQSAVLLAQCLARGNRPEQAIEQYRRVIAGGGRFVADALAGLGTILVERGEYEEAGKQLDRLLRDFPDSPHATASRLNRGRVWLEAGQFDRGLELFTTVAAGDSELASEAAYWSAKCELRKGEGLSAARRLTDAISRFPQSPLLPEMMYDRGIALLRAGKTDEAVEGLERFRESYGEHALAAEALRLLAATEHQQKRYERSGAYCTRFMTEYPRSDTVAEMAFLAAENDFLAGDMERAAAAFQHFVQTYANDGQTAKAKLRLGLSLYRLERFDQAASWLAQVATQEHELFRPALLALGDIHFHRGEWKQAEAYFAQYVRAGADEPAGADALLKLGLARQRQERYEEALGVYADLLKRHPQSACCVQATFERGQCLAALKRWDEAVAAFEAVAAEGQENALAAHALNQLGTIAASRGQSDRAAKLFGRLGETAQDVDIKADAVFQQAQALAGDRRFPAAEAAYRAYLGQFPSGKDALEAEARLAIALARQDRHAEAVTAMEVLQRKDLSKLESMLRAALGYEKGWCLRALGRNDEAAEALRKAIDEPSPGSYALHAMLELGGLESAAGRHEAALAILQRMRDQLAGKDGDEFASLREQCTYRLAMAHMERAQFDPAAALLDEFLVSFPKSSYVAAASFYAGEAALELKRHEKAASQFTRVIKEFKDDAVYGPALLRLGECLAVLQRWALSEQTFATYVDRFSGSDSVYQAHFGLGWARENQKRFVEAMSAYEQVIARNQSATAARAQFQIGQCFFAQQKYEDAVRELLKVDILYAYPEWSAAALYEAGRCFERLNKPAEAQAQFAQVAAKYKDTNWAELANQRLHEPSTAAAVPGRS